MRNLRTMIYVSQSSGTGSPHPGFPGLSAVKRLFCSVVGTADQCQSFTYDRSREPGADELYNGM